MSVYCKALQCRECGKEYPLEARYVCEFCFGPLEVAYDYEKIKKHITREKIEARPLTMWRYKEFLPANGDDPVSLQEGYTPLLRARNLGALLGLKELWLKNDCANPTHSFKDRVVSVAVTKAVELGFKTVSCASTGNLANAVSAYGARAGMVRYVFIPANLEAGKVVASNVYQPHLVKVEGNYDEVNRLCSEIAGKHRWAFVNINVRPYYAEGSKTLGFEVVEQMGWKAPDHVVVPMASGSLLTKIYKALGEFHKTGLIGEPHTRVSGAQANGCSPISTAFLEGSDTFRPVKPNTIAKSLAIGNPADGYYALQAIKASGGAAERASDEEIIEGIKLLASTEGIFAETAGGVTIACLKKLVQSGKIRPDEKTVAYITGTGLKTQEALHGHLEEPRVIKPNLAAFEASQKTLALT
ncbi:MAG TPA: threonine synthase [bacterium]|jgi:threonine synthase|nr:threonine synthase [bacterium]